MVKVFILYIKLKDYLVTHTSKNESDTDFCEINAVLFLQISDQVGTGNFADFSKVQYVNISGTINSVDPSSGMITYLPQILYKFSCFYPMQYLVNNTQLSV